MSNLTYAQLEGIWQQAAAGTQYASQTWAALMAAIAEAESGGNPAALNPNDNGGKQSSFGLWQISTGTHNPPSATWNNPLTNAQLAIGKLQSQGLGAWGTYTSGAYKAFLNSSTTPDQSGIVGAADTSAAAASVQTGSDANCAWSIGWGGIPGTSWLNDIFGGGGNVGSGAVCLLSKPQVRGIAGIALMLVSFPIIMAGFSIALTPTAMKVAGDVIGVRAITGAVGKLTGKAAAGAASKSAAPAATEAAPVELAA